MNYARRAYAIAQNGIKKRMEALARAVDAEGPRVVVFNSLPYAHDAEVEVGIPEGFSLPGGVREGGKVRFLAKGLPPGGYKTFNVVHGEQVKHVNNLNDLPVLHGQKNNGEVGSPLPAVANGVALSRKGVRVTAFCPNPDGEGTVLRVWEQAGRGGEITVTLPPGMKIGTAQPVNLRGELAGAPVPESSGGPRKCLIFVQNPFCR